MAINIIDSMYEICLDKFAAYNFSKNNLLLIIAYKEYVYPFFS